MAGRSGGADGDFGVIGHFAAFHSNYGDIMYRPVLEALLQQENAATALRGYSLVDGDAPLRGGFGISKIADFVNESSHGEVSSLIIGGGAVLKPTSPHVAKNFNAEVRRRRWRRPVRAVIESLRDARDPQGRDDRFRREFLNYPHLSPFLLAPSDFARPVPVAYCSCGAGSAFPHLPREAAREAFDQAAFLYVRDEWTGRLIRELGVRVPVHVAPDLVVSLSRTHASADLPRQGNVCLRKHGVPEKRPLLVFQCVPPANPADFESLRGALRCVSDQKQYTLALLPIGYCHGDHEVLARLAAEIPSHLVLAKDIWEIAGVIAVADAFVGTSMHGCITAFSFGVPFVIGPTPHAKQAGFLDVCGINRDLELSSWSGLPERLAWSCALGPDYFGSRLATAQARVSEAVRSLAQALGI